MKTIATTTSEGNPTETTVSVVHAGDLDDPPSCMPRLWAMRDRQETAAHAIRARRASLRLATPRRRARAGRAPRRRAARPSVRRVARAGPKDPPPPLFAA